MSDVGSVLYVNFWLEYSETTELGYPANGATTYLIWKCPLETCALEQRLLSQQIQEDLECRTCGLRMTPALGLLEEMLQDGGAIITQDGGFVYTRHKPLWWATRIWKYTVSGVGERPSRFQLLMEDELQDESIVVENPGTFDQSELLESLWTFDSEKDWAEAESQRENWRENNIPGVKTRRTGACSSMFIRHEPTESDDG